MKEALANPSPGIYASEHESMQANNLCKRTCTRSQECMNVEAAARLAVHSAPILASRASIAEAAGPYPSRRRQCTHPVEAAGRIMHECGGSGALPVSPSTMLSNGPPLLHAITGRPPYLPLSTLTDNIPDTHQIELEVLNEVSHRPPYLPLGYMADSER